VVLRVRYFTSGTDVPAWVTGLSMFSPMIVPPVDAAGAIGAILHIAAGAGLAGVLSHRVAGRQP
jgi:hypothetical protein